MEEAIDECENEEQGDTVSCEEGEDTDSSDGEMDIVREPIQNTDEPFKLTHFQRSFPHTTPKDGFPLATARARMVERRPLWLPKFGLDMAYFKHASYFSEIISREQLSRQALIDAMYKPKYGEYKFCKSQVLKKQFLSKYLHGVHSCKFSPDGQFIVLGFGNGSLEVMNTRQHSREVHFIKGQPNKITAIRFIDNDVFFASSMTGRVYMGKKYGSRWKFYSFLKELKNEINGLDTNGNYLATAGKDACIRIYDTSIRKLVQVFPRAGINLTESAKQEASDEIPEERHYRRICAIRYDPSHTNIFATGGWDNIVKIWDCRAGRNPVRSILGPHICGDAIDIMDNNILTGQWTCNDSLQLWDMSTCKLIQNISPLNRPICYSGEFINSAQFIQNWAGRSTFKFPKARGDLIIAAGSGTKAMEVISIKENVVLHASEEANAVVALDHCKFFISYGSVNNIYSIVKFYPYAGKLSLSKKLLHENKEPTTTNKETGRTECWNPVIVDMEYLELCKKLKEEAAKDHLKTPKQNFVHELIEEIRREETCAPKSILREKLDRYTAKVKPCTDLLKGKYYLESTQLNEDPGTYTFLPQE